METIDYMKYYFVTLGEKTQLEAENKRLRVELETKSRELTKLKLCKNNLTHCKNCDTLTMGK